jgi:predicted transcriptional regulator
LASSFLEKVFDGAVDEYLVYALESKRLSSAELDQLEAMLASARQRAKKPRRKGDAK